MSNDESMTKVEIRNERTSDRRVHGGSGWRCEWSLREVPPRYLVGYKILTA